MRYHSPRPQGQKKNAEVVKLVDTQRSGRCARKGMGVRVPPSAPRIYTTTAPAVSRAAGAVFCLLWLWLFDGKPTLQLVESLGAITSHRLRNKGPLREQWRQEQHFLVWYTRRRYVSDPRRWGQTAWQSADVEPSPGCRVQLR